MKKIICLLLASASLFSCKSYMINTMSSTTAHTVENTGILIAETDSVRISYNFEGENSPLKIEIYNKLNEPLFVNWANSAIIYQGKAYSIAGNNATVDLTATGDSWKIDRSISLTDGKISGNIGLPKDMSFLPPHAAIDRTTGLLNSIDGSAYNSINFTKTAFNSANGEGIIYTKAAEFTAADSPLSFKCYITCYTLKDNQPKPFALQQDFFISRVVKTHTRPKQIMDFAQPAGNVNIRSAMSGYGKTMTVIGLTAGTLGAAALSSTIDDKEKHKE